METGKPIKEYERIKYSDKDMWYANSKVAVGVFFIALIYARFLWVESSTQAMKQEVKEMKTLVNSIKLELNTRLDKKTARNKEFIDKNTAEIEKLKQPNSDN